MLLREAVGCVCVSRREAQAPHPLSVPILRLRILVDGAAMFRFMFLFLILLITFFVLELLQPVELYVIEPFTAAIAKVCVWIVGVFDSNAIAYGKILRSTSVDFAISIERGCNGVEAIIILVSAMLAFPAPWKHRLVGIGVGFVAIQALNLVRIISLFYLGQWNRMWFEWFHLYLWQALIILDALVVFLLWLRWLPRRASVQPREEDAAGR